MSQKSTSCWIRRCNRQYIFLPQFTLVSRCRARDEKIPLSNSFASSICDRRDLSLFTASAAAGPEPWGADDRPNSLEKRDTREQSFPREKSSQCEHSIPSRTERACSSPKHITHKSCVSSDVKKTLTQIDTPLIAFLNRHICYSHFRNKVP